MYLAAALDGFGAHPAAWHRSGTAGLYDPARVVAMARLAEEGRLDLVTLDDQQPVTAAGGVPHGALDASLVLATAAGATVHLGLFATGVATGDPVVAAARIATFDRVTGGRGGWRPRVALTDEERRRATEDPERYAAFTEERFAQATDFTGAVTELWAAWREDDRSGPRRVVRRGGAFGVDACPKVPVLPSGPPLTAVLAHFSTPYRLAARHADLVFVTPFSRDDVVAVLTEVRAHCAEQERGPVPLTVLADLDVVLADTEAEAAARRSALDALAPQVSDAATFTGTPAGLADLLEEWHSDGGVDGFRLRPAVLSEDLPKVVSGLVPVLRERGLCKTAYGTSLRSRLRSGAP